MPGEFVVEVETPLAPAQAWTRVWDLDRHTEVIPFTTVVLEPPATRLAVGARFCGRTARGPIGFDDPMRVVVWESPTTGGGRAVVVKTGSVIGGRIEATVTPVAGGALRCDEGASKGSGTRITWRQRVELPWLPSPLSWLERPVARLVAPGYRLVLRRLLDQRGT